MTIDFSDGISLGDLIVALAAFLSAWAVIWRMVAGAVGSNYPAIPPAATAGTTWSLRVHYTA